MVYFGETVNVADAGGFNAAYDCRRCGHQELVRGWGSGVGEGDNAYFLTERSAIDEAVTNAAASAAGDAAESIGLAACPRCGRRNRQSIVLCALENKGGHFIAVALFVGLLVWLSWGTPQALKAVLAIAALVLPVMAGWTSVRVRERLRKADHMVEFSSRPAECPQNQSMPAALNWPPTA